MADLSPEHEGEVPVIQTEAELTLKKLLDKQLATRGRLEQVDFHEARESMHCVGHGSSGIATLSEYLKNEWIQKQLEEKERSLRTILQSKGFSKSEVEERCRRISSYEESAVHVCDKGIKRKRYGAHPSFTLQAESEEHDIVALQKKYEEDRLKVDSSQQNFGRHAKELEASLLRGKKGLQPIAHLSAGGSSCRKPLVSKFKENEICIGATPQDRARFRAKPDISRSTDEVFSKMAPEVLDLHTYLEERESTMIATTTSTAGVLNPLETFGSDIVATVDGPEASKNKAECDIVKDISDEYILSNRLLDDEIRKLPCGKFVNYSPGEPSHILYIKNLSSDVLEADLAALFLRYQSSGQKLTFRLMQRGRMKGQAFITFADKETAGRALELANGFKLKGRPLVIEFGRTTK